MGDEGGPSVRQWCSLFRALWRRQTLWGSRISTITYFPQRRAFWICRHFLSCAAHPTRAFDPASEGGVDEQYKLNNPQMTNTVRKFGIDNFLPWRRPSVRNLQQRARVMWDNGTFPLTWEAEQGSLSPLPFTAHRKGGSRHACCPLCWRHVPSVDFKRHTDWKTRSKNAPTSMQKNLNNLQKNLVEEYMSLAWLQHTRSVYNYQVYFMYYQRTTAILNIAFILASKILTNTCNNRCSDVYT